MNRKRILRFYFRADALNALMDNIILAYALRSAEGTLRGEYYAGRISEFIGAKVELSSLWNYLDGVISAMREEEVETLKFYALTRKGINGLDEDVRRRVKRSVIKFTRRARGLERFRCGIRLVGEYYCMF